MSLHLVCIKGYNVSVCCRISGTGEEGRKGRADGQSGWLAETNEERESK